ncbi:MAG: hypothetical protein KDD52_08410 [Bdellovibrionales bacterium]|nr:hypothetical protein [Bdellovibrionales bacterium]
MEYLYQGLLRYQKHHHANEQENLQRLKESQNPASLLVTCSDSRLSVSQFTDSKAGDVFVLRNAGNMITPYNEENPSYPGLSLEYGVSALKVKEIIICGHVSCGAMKGLQHPEELGSMPLVKKGLEHAARQFSFDPAKIDLNELILENVKLQMRNVLDYPFVKKNVDEGQLHVWGWVYDFVEGQLKNKVSMKDLL